MKQLETKIIDIIESNIYSDYDNVKKASYDISLLTKDIAIGFAEWSQYNCFRHEGDWVYDKILYTSEELFNEYLNTLK